MSYQCNRGDISISTLNLSTASGMSQRQSVPPKGMGGSPTLRASIPVVSSAKARPGAKAEGTMAKHTVVGSIRGGTYGCSGHKRDHDPGGGGENGNGGGPGHPGSNDDEVASCPPVRDDCWLT